MELRLAVAGGNVSSFFRRNLADADADADADEDQIMVADQIPQIGDTIQNIKFKLPAYDNETDEIFKKVLIKLDIFGSSNEVNSKLRQLLTLPTQPQGGLGIGLRA